MPERRFEAPQDAWAVLLKMRKREHAKKRGLIPLPEVDSIDGDTVRIFFPESNTQIAFELLFPSTDAKDQFLLSQRTRRDAEKAGGILLTNNPTRDTSQNGVMHEEEGDQPLYGSASAYELSIKHGLQSPGEYLDAVALVWSALCEGESKKKDFAGFLKRLVRKN